MSSLREDRDAERYTLEGRLSRLIVLLRAYGGVPVCGWVTKKFANGLSFEQRNKRLNDVRHWLKNHAWRKDKTLMAAFDALVEHADAPEDDKMAKDLVALIRSRPPG